MPFKTTTTLPSSRVEVYLRGLLLIQPDSASTACEIGVHNGTTDHVLQIAITRSSQTLGRTDLLCHHVGKVKNTLSNKVLIWVHPRKGGGVSAYKPTAGDFDRSKENKDEDLQWAIRLQNSKEFHTGALSMLTAGTSPRILMDDGVFFTAERTDKKDFKITRKRGGETDLPLHSIAKVIGVRFDLAAGDQVVVEVNEDTCNQTFRLPQAGDPGDATYEIYIRNDPPQYGSGVGHDELEEYYDVLLKDGAPIASGERFTLLAEMAEKAEGLVLFTTDRIPCMPVLIDG